MRYAVPSALGPLGFYELNTFPGCNQIVVSNHAFIEKGERGKGLGNEAHFQRLSKMRELGYDYALCTVVKDNEAQIHILEKNGWRKLDEFWNRETEHQVLIYGRLLRVG